MILLDLIFVSIAVAVIAMDISKTKLFEPFRDWCECRSVWVHKLVMCPWCLAHWIAAPAVLVRGVSLWWVFVVVGCSAVPMLVIDWLFKRLDKKE